MQNNDKTNIVISKGGNIGFCLHKNVYTYNCWLIMYAKHCSLQSHAKNADMRILSAFNYDECTQKRMKTYSVYFHLKHYNEVNDFMTT